MALFFRKGGSQTLDRWFWRDENTHLYHGYRLLACDGTIVNVARTPEDSDMFFHASGDKSDKGFTQLRLNAL